jgi:hypothetical protein
MANLFTVYQNVERAAADGDAPVTLEYQTWLELRNDPEFRELSHADLLARLGSDSRIEDFNALESELYEARMGNGSFELRTGYKMKLVEIYSTDQYATLRGARESGAVYDLFVPDLLPVNHLVDILRTAGDCVSGDLEMFCVVVDGVAFNAN